MASPSAMSFGRNSSIFASLAAPSICGNSFTNMTIANALPISPISVAEMSHFWWILRAFATP
jgi:hypothetical protein